MKQGSTDDPFADAPAEEERDDEPDDDGPNAPAPSGLGSDSDGASSGADERSAGSSETVRRGTDPHERTLPYIHARDSVKDGRTQRPIFLRDEIEAGVDELVDDVEDRIGGTVYKTDVMEAAVVLAQENPDLVEAKLREWGYGMAGEF